MGTPIQDHPVTSRSRRSLLLSAVGNIWLEASYVQRLCVCCWAVSVLCVLSMSLQLRFSRARTISEIAYFLQKQMTKYRESGKVRLSRHEQQVKVHHPLKQITKYREGGTNCIDASRARAFCTNCSRIASCWPMRASSIPTTYNNDGHPTKKKQKNRTRRR